MDPKSPAGGQPAQAPSPTRANRGLGEPPVSEAVPPGSESDTLRGAVRALAEVLAVVDPSSYAQALRIQRRARELAQALALSASETLDTAALLAPLGRISLPQDLQRRLHEGEALDAEEQRIVDCVPQLTDRLLAAIPGLEDVRAVILLRHRLPLPGSWRDGFGEPRCAMLGQLAAALRMAAEFDALLGRGYALSEALGLLRGEATGAMRAMADTFAALHADDQPGVELRSLPLSRLRPGMVIAEAVYTQAGQLLVNRGFEITDGFLERVRDFRRGLVREPVQVILPGRQTSPDAGR